MIAPQLLASLWPKFRFGVTLDANLPRLWMQQEEYHRSKPGSTIPPASPNFQAAISDRVMH
jgi:hypothetical protein